jgi:hypothetical protein
MFTLLSLILWAKEIPALRSVAKVGLAAINPKQKRKK